MTCEVHHILAKVEFLVDIPHGGLFGVHTFHGFGVVLVEVGHEDQELAEAPLLKETHKTYKGTNRFELWGLWSFLEALWHLAVMTSNYLQQWSLFFFANIVN